MVTAPGIQTELSTTVFSGEAQEWLRYLRLSPSDRCEPELSVRVHLQPDMRIVACEPENEDSRWLADLVALSLRRTRQHLAGKPKVESVFDDLLFKNARRSVRWIGLRLSPEVP